MYISRRVSYLGTILVPLLARVLKEFLFVLQNEEGRGGREEEGLIYLGLTLNGGRGGGGYYRRAD